MNNEQSAPACLVERLLSYIPDGDGYNSQYAKDLVEAVELLAAAPKAEQPPVQEPVATVTIQHFRQDPRMENVDFQLQVTLPQGTHKLYAAPQPVSDDARDALVEALEVLAKLGNGEHYGNSDGNVIAQMALAAYRAAQEKPHD